MDAVSMDAVRVIHGGGTPENAWQRCPWLWSRAPEPLDALLGAAEHLWVLAPHPDDEVLACGGLMQQAVRSGRDVRVVAVTDGEACYPGESWWTPERLRATRRAELHASLDVLGVDAGATVHLGIADGRVAAAEDQLLTWLKAHIASSDVVLAPWHVDGHPDHESAGRAARLATQACGARLLEYPVWGWHWLDPACAQMAWQRPMLLDIREAWRDKQHAIACFRSQTGAVDHLRSAPILPEQVLRRFQRPVEVFLA